MRRPRVAIRRTAVLAGWRMVRLWARPAGNGAAPEVVFLFAGAEPGARGALEALPEEARVWRMLAQTEEARARARSRDGHVRDAGVCAGRAEAYRTAAAQLEDLLIESLGLWDEYERQAGEG